ncbi:hypothetical protein KB879_21030 [Cupriavidus sp. KK10]|jgi:hypothetical protein|uniref:hypothetical protein n=1 Tax=Cupriavidus sp. KK10 TaxID=1478019 RepID=UPI001BADEB5D|nr:hypothetical protein [Cupriavidus sp. KK10]QUN26603.1 hypothetical protein KB879_21030 [Cupriavidus sp. KK10]
MIASMDAVNDCIITPMLSLKQMLWPCWVEPVAQAPTDSWRMWNVAHYFSAGNFFSSRVLPSRRDMITPLPGLAGSYAAQSGFPPPDTGDKTNNIVWHDCGTADMTGQCAPPAASVSAQYRTPERNR